ncbi:MAG: histidine kinase [Candidatus Lokiarchaeum sp. GC14_75]|nr:MAG: histidine kinase [Candidatus Lokiarchaeum sp. GC14_75]
MQNGDIHILRISDYKQQKNDKGTLNHSTTLEQAILDAMSEAVFLIDLDNKILQCNKSTVKFLGKSKKDEIIGQTYWELLHGTSSPVEGCPFMSMCESGQRETLIYNVMGREMEISADPFFDEEGKIMGAVHIITDITDQKQMEDQIKGLEEKYRTIVNSLSDPIHVVDKNLKITFLNPAMTNWLAKLNISPNIVGKTIFEAFPFLVYEKVFSEYEKVFQSKTRLTSSGKSVIENKIIFTELIKIPIIHEGCVNQVITVLRDITEQINISNKFETVIENLIDMIAILDFKGEFLYVSPQVYNITGFTQEEIIGKNGFTFIHPNDLDKVLKTMARLLKERKRVSLEYRTLNKEGNYIIVSASGRIAKIDGEEKIIMAIRDISKRKISEQKLRESEEKFRNITDQSLMGIGILQDGVFRYFNKQFEEIIGFSREEINGWSSGEFLEAIHPDDRDFVREQARKKQQGAKDALTQYQFRGINQEGKTEWREVHSKSIKYSNKLADLIAVVDINERKIAEEKLIQSEDNFRTIAEQALMGILIMQDDKVEYVNSTVLQIFEYSFEEVKNWSMKDLINIIHPDDLKLLRKSRLEMRTNNSNITAYYSFRAFTKSGKLRWIDQFSKIIVYKGRQAELVTIMDITDKKEVEQELIKLSTIKSELLRRTSHELKTPLVSIKGFSNLLLELYSDKLDDYVLNTIGEIKQGCIRLEDLIRDILKSAELDSESVQLKKTSEDLSFLIRVCVNELKEFVKLRNHSINLQLQDDLITCFEKEQIHQVVSNLLTNAIKFTPINGVIELKSIKKEDSLIFSIKDNGIGFIDEEKERLFKQFGKIERYGQGLDIVSDGSGLGLYISKKIIELHGGKIWLESEGRSKGSTFNFTLPLISESN